MTAPNEARIEVSALAALVAALFRAAGVPADAAARMGEIILHAERRGTASHGCAMVPGYVERLLRGEIDPKAEPRVAGEAGAAIRVDAGGGLGHLAAAFAMGRAIERARALGVAVASVSRSNHCGALAYYAMQALPHDMIGIAVANSIPTMAWPGGSARILGMNPVAVAIPAAAEPPVVLDTGFGTTSRGRIVLHAQRGEALPEGWATDAEGNPTTDAATALAGLILPAGGHKGAGLALVAGILAGVLSGGAYGGELGDLARGALPGRDGQLVMAIDIAAFTDAACFKGRIDGILREIRASGRRPDGRPPRAPGARAAEAMREADGLGIALAPAVRTALAGLSARLGVDAGALGP